MPVFLRASAAPARSGSVDRSFGGPLRGEVRRRIGVSEASWMEMEIGPMNLKPTIRSLQGRSWVSAALLMCLALVLAVPAAEAYDKTNTPAAPVPTSRWG